MAKNANFAGELESISTAVEKDVGRVINLLRDEKVSDADTGEKAAHTARPSEGAPKVDRHVADAPEPAATSTPTARSRVKMVGDGEQVILENVTTRISRETNQLLTEAALRQKLAKQTPDTRQDIIETAVRHWLKTNSYLR